jgi:hypothetical protein
MRVDTKAHTCHGGLDLHARPRSLGLFNQDGEIMRHRQRNAAPEPFLQAIAPDRADLVVCVDGLLAWDWLADLCAYQGMPCVLGHARSRKAMQGGTAQHDHIDAHQIAVLRRGGMRPQADVEPAQRRATRDLRRRRRPLGRPRAARLAPLPQPNRPSHLPASGTKLASKATRAGGAARRPEPASQKSLAVARTLIHPDARLLTDLERARGSTATAHEAPTFSRLRAIPGGGKRLALVRRDERHALHRCPRGQACVSSGRRVQGANDSAGQRDGTAGQKLGHADLHWAFSAAAVRFLRQTPAGPQDLARGESRPGPGKALTVRAHTLARAGYSLLQRETAVDGDKGRHESGSGVDAPAASLDAKGLSRTRGGLVALRGGVSERRRAHRPFSRLPGR